MWISHWQWQMVNDIAYLEGREGRHHHTRLYFTVSSSHLLLFFLFLFLFSLFSSFLFFFLFPFWRPPQSGARGGRPPAPLATPLLHAARKWISSINDFEDCVTLRSIIWQIVMLIRWHTNRRDSTDNRSRHVVDKSRIYSPSTHRSSACYNTCDRPIDQSHV